MYPGDGVYIEDKEGILNRMQPLWQRYDEQGQPLAGQGAPRDEVFTSALLHGAAHVWIWRIVGGRPQVLLQKRAANKATWPNCYDISAAGHIDVGEDPMLAAIRATHEEIGLSVAGTDLQFIGTIRVLMHPSPTQTENEFQWLYLLNLPKDYAFSMQEAEVAAIEWRDLDVFAEETRATTNHYVPHGQRYYDTVVAGIERAIATKE